MRKLEDLQRLLSIGKPRKKTAAEGEQDVRREGGLK